MWTRRTFIIRGYPACGPARFHTLLECSFREISGKKKKLVHFIYDFVCVSVKEEKIALLCIFFPDESYILTREVHYDRYEFYLALIFRGKN